MAEPSPASLDESTALETLTQRLRLFRRLSARMRQAVAEFPGQSPEEVLAAAADLEALCSSLKMPRAELAYPAGDRSRAAATRGPHGLPSPWGGSNGSVPEKSGPAACSRARQGDIAGVAREAALTTLLGELRTAALEVRQLNAVYLVLLREARRTATALLRHAASYAPFYDCLGNAVGAAPPMARETTVGWQLEDAPSGSGHPLAGPALRESPAAATEGSVRKERPCRTVGPWEAA